MKILVACEESQAVTMEFRKLGHDAYSCDVIPCSGGHPEWHLQQDALELLKEKWDMIIAFPPCTYLTNASAVHLFPGKKLNHERYEKGLKAKEFFMRFYNADCEKIAIENPIPLRIFELPSYDQIVHPYEHGHPYTKKTCLWLKGLPKLIPSNIVYEYVKSWVYEGAKATKTESRSKIRSKTFPGIAKAMATQWGQGEDDYDLMLQQAFGKKI